ncbi:hypothetical protein [Pseudonocardia zijingensis]|uniref:hypothetical protein n=1 Tax=Pseudonocardia zijingensis TaxID=153376 RepID=UPI0036D38B49
MAGVCAVPRVRAVAARTPVPFVAFVTFVTFVRSLASVGLVPTPLVTTVPDVLPVAVAPVALGRAVRCVRLAPAVILRRGVTTLAVSVGDQVVRARFIAGPTVAGVAVGVAFGFSVVRARPPAGGRARRGTARSLRALERGIGQQCTRLVELAVRMPRCTDVRPSAWGGHPRPDLLDDGVERRPR